VSLADRMIDLPTFLAYSVVMEEEAADRHDELADVMDVHNNPDVAATFRKLAHYSRLHAQEIREQSKDLQLPKIAPWEFEWEDGEPPETTESDEVHYLMNRAQALRLAMENEQRAHDFYADIARHAPEVAVRALAAEFAEEEREHLDLLIEWRKKIPESEDEPLVDDDPAHMPE
jgi:rubrerythrin